MATKSTKFRNLTVLKIAAVILAAICFFTAGLSACLQIRKSYYYDGKNNEGLTRYENSTVFRSNMNYFESSLLAKGELMSCENETDFAKTTAGKNKAEQLKKTEKTIRDACSFLDSLGENFEIYVSYENEYRYHYSGENSDYYFDYIGELISKDDFDSFEYVSSFVPGGNASVQKDETETVKPDEKAEDVSGTEAFTTVTMPEDSSYPNVESDINGDTTRGVLINDTDDKNVRLISKCLRDVYENSYETHSEINDEYGYHYNYGEKSTDELLEICRNVYSYANADNDLGYLNDTLDKVSGSFRYAVFYNTTGKYITNCGVTAGDTAEEILKKLGGQYYEYVEKGEYFSLYDYNENSAFSRLSGFFGESKIAPLIENYSDESIERMYFGCDVNGDDSVFCLSRGCYEGYMCDILHPDDSNLIVICIISLLAGLACSVFLFVKAGKTSDGETRIMFADKIPFLISLALVCGFTVVCAAPVVAIHIYEFDPVELLVYQHFPSELAFFLNSRPSAVCAAFISLCGIVIVAFVCGIIRNIRCRTFFRHTLTFSLIRFVKKLLKLIKKIYCKTFGRIVAAVREYLVDDCTNKSGRIVRIVTIICLCFVTFIDFLLIFGFGRGAVPFVIPFVLTVLIDLFLIWMLICLDRLSKGINQIRLGNFNVEIDRKYMPSFMKAAANNICSIRDGLSESVSNALKQQATKTELITNVTHDLKTPLTSIITYVDLLGKTNNPEEQKEYLAVLDEKSQKLKKLIDDLVQVSKASGGTLEIKAATLDLCEFVKQIAGEYTDELSEAGIELIVRSPETPLYVYADPGVTERIFENLIVNIRKYALKGSRAYIEVRAENDFGMVGFKNTSASIIDCDPDRLKERFFRADSSRTGEGSGLGLSITDSLCTAQGGRFEIETDADLFKALVYLPLKNQ